MQTTATINISLPIKLKAQADELVSKGYFASFSDLTRTALRHVINNCVYDYLIDEAKREEESGKGKILENDKDVEEFVHGV